MKKTCMLICVFFIFFTPVTADKNHFEVFCAYNQMAMTDYNDYITDANTIYELFGIDAQFQKLNTALVTEVSWVAVLESENAGDWGVYARAGRLNLFDDKSKAAWPDGTVFETIASDYSVFYTGLGIRKYIAVFYAGVDAGAYYNWNNNVKDSLYWSDDGINYDSYTFERTWNTFLLGYNLEAGMDFWLTDFFGLAVRGGYRYCKGIIAVNWGEYYGNRVFEENVDYTGMYIGAGMMFKTGSGKKQDFSGRETKW